MNDPKQEQSRSNQNGSAPSASDTDAPNANPQASTAAGEPDPFKVLEALRVENAELKDRSLRTLAEMENLRRRTEREVTDAKAYGVTSFARDMLTFADNLRRAIDAVPGRAARERRSRVEELHRGYRADGARFRVPAQPVRRQEDGAAGQALRPQSSRGSVRTAGRKRHLRDRHAGHRAGLPHRRSHPAARPRSASHVVAQRPSRSPSRTDLGVRGRRTACSNSIGHTGRRRRIRNRGPRTMPVTAEAGRTEAFRFRIFALPTAFTLLMPGATSQ